MSGTRWWGEVSVIFRSSWQSGSVVRYYFRPFILFFVVCEPMVSSEPNFSTCLHIQFTHRYRGRILRLALFFGQSKIPSKASAFFSIIYHSVYSIVNSFFYSQHSKIYLTVCLKRIFSSTIVSMYGGCWSLGNLVQGSFSSLAAGDELWPVCVFVYRSRASMAYTDSSASPLLRPPPVNNRICAVYALVSAEPW